MNQTFSQRLAQWRNKELESRYLMVFLDAIDVKVRRDTVQGEAFYVAMAVKEDFTREIIALENYRTESAEGWNAVLEKRESDKK